MRVHSLTTRFVLTLLLSTAVPFLAFGWIVRQAMQRQLESQVANVLLSGHAALIADRIENLLEQIERDCAHIQIDAQWRLSGRLTGREFQTRLDLMRGFSKDFQLAILADIDGRVLNQIDSLNLGPARGAERLALAPKNVRHEAWFQRIVDGGLGMTWVGRHLSPYLHRNPARTTNDPLDYSLGLAFLVQDAGKRGVLYALVDWKRIQDIVDSIARRLKIDAGFDLAEAFLCDDAGTVLACSDRGLYSKTLEPDTLLTAVVDSVAPGVTHYEDSDDGPALAGHSPVERTTGAEFEWRCGIAAPASQLFAASYQFGRSLLLAIALISLILVAWSLYASRAILRPVRRLADATRLVARGDLTTRVPTRGRDELAELGRAFNAMAEQLAENRERLRETERAAAWAEMARQVAHEIKNPLTPMRMSAQLLEKARRENDPRLPQLVDRLSRSVIEQTEHLARIASDFRTFARAPEPNIERVPADEVVEDIAKDFAAFVEDGSSAVVLEPGAPGAFIEVDRIELRRVFINLVQNALEAGGEGAEVTVASRLEGDSVVYTVRDNGPGIPGDLQGRLFEPYFTTRSSGTGLGLAICRRLVEAHGGTISLARSGPGATEFRVEFRAYRVE